MTDNSERTADSNRRRWGRPLLVVLLALFLVVAGLFAWRVWPRQRTFYTDAASIRQSAEEALLRDVLWEPPVQVLAEVLDGGANEYEPRLSWDGLTLFFVRGKAGENADIFVSRRSPEGWSDPRPLDAINSDYDDLGPECSSDGRSLYFYSDRPGGAGGYDLWVSHLGSEGWKQPVNLGPRVNSEFNEYGPALAPAGKTLYFASNRPQPTDVEEPNPDAWPATLREDFFHRDYDLYIAALTDAGAGVAAPLVSLNTPHNEGSPAVSPAGDFLYFSSDRSGGCGGYDLYRTRRTQDRHRAPANLGASVNSAANELDPGLSLGGYALYFSSDRRDDLTGAESPIDYSLYRTVSREVFAEIEDVQNPIDWAAFWRQVGPNLLWCLLILLLLALLPLLLRDLRWRKLGLLAKCLLASVMAHLLLLLLLNAWEVTASFTRLARGGGKHRIALVPAARADGIAAQIRRHLTDVQAPAPRQVRHQRPDVALRRPAAAETAELTVERRPIEFGRHQPARPQIAEATTLPLRLTQHRDVPRKSEAASLELPLPAEMAPMQANEPDAISPNTVATVPRLTGVRSSIPSPPASTPSPDVELAPDALPGEELARAAPMAESLFPVQDAASPSTSTPLAGARQAVVAPAPPVKLSVPQSQASPPAAAEPPTITVAAASLPPSRARPAVDQASLCSAEVVVWSDPVAADVVTPEPIIERAAVSDAVGSWSAPEARPAVQGGNPVIRPPSPATLALPALEEAETMASGEPAAPSPATPLAAPSAPRRRYDTAESPVPGATQFTLAAPERPDVAPFHLPGHVAHQSATDAPGPILDAPQASYARPAVAATRPLDLRLPTETSPQRRPYEHRSPEHRLEMVQGRGGSEQTERAVALALRWLADHQSPDGRWDGEEFDAACGGCGGETAVDVDVALTGLSLLCFLGADHTHTRDGPYRDTVDRGLSWLVDGQTPEGDLRDGETMYSQGIAAIAVSEALGMTGDPDLVDPVRRAAQFIDAARDRSIGGWRYDPGQPGDTSVLGWQIMALKSAQLAGVDVSADSFAAAAAWLELVGSPANRGPTGSYAYQPGRPPNLAMTAEGMFVQHLLGRRPDEPRMQASAAILSQSLPDWDSYLDTYYWYYATLAMFQQGGQAWERWNHALTGQLLPHQEKRGPRAGSWEPAGKWAPTAGRVYQTALCTLMLEVYYRYLPLYDIESPADAIGTIRGRVTDAATGRPLPGATVRLDLPDRSPATADADGDGQYHLSAPDVPDYFALSASLDGYTPEAVNVATIALAGRTMTLDFELHPRDRLVIALEPDPQVHHLGNDAFTGRVNSQFQRSTEGSALTTHFAIDPGQLAACSGTAEIVLLAKGVQCPHRIRINGELLRSRLDDSPADGSFGEFTARFDADLLREGTNSLQIQAVRCRGDLDDFEFVNVRIRLAPDSPVDDV